MLGLTKSVRLEYAARGIRVNAVCPGVIDVVRLRHSCRGFLARPVSINTINEVLEDAQLSPSNCNTQPWNVHIVSGDKKEELSNILIDAHRNSQLTPDFTFDTAHFSGRYKERQFAQGKAYYGGLGVLRGDKAGRDEANIKNYRFYNAPHVALFFMPGVGDNIRVAADIVMYAQTFLLSLTAHGLAGVPQTVIGFFPVKIRKFLGIQDNYKMLFGISFGYEDIANEANEIKMVRDSITSNVKFH